MSVRVLSPTKNYSFPTIPLLENGDRLSREEFHRRYEAMPENVKAELIKGVVYFRTKTKVSHGEANATIVGLIGLYSINSLGTNFVIHPTLIFDGKNECQPDAVLRIDENCGGKSWINDDDYLEGSPELIVEISSSTASYDLHDKFEIYEKKGVQEYIVWRVLDHQIDWFSLKNGKYERLSTNKQGIIESKSFADLRLNLKAMLKDDLKRVLVDLHKGLQSKKYKEFFAALSN